MSFETDGFGYLIWFQETDKNTAVAMYKLLDLRRGQIVYDLGCGDGQLLCPAGNFGLRGVGFEIDKGLAADATYHMERNKHPVKIINDDFGKIKYWRHLCNGQPGEVQIADADGILLYLETEPMAKIMPRLRRELRPGTRIVSNGFKFPDSWEPSRTMANGEVGQHDFIYLYEV